MGFKNQNVAMGGGVKVADQLVIKLLYPFFFIATVHINRTPRLFQMIFLIFSEVDVQIAS